MAISGVSHYYGQLVASGCEVFAFLFGFCLSTYLVGVSSIGVEGMRLKMLMEVSESVMLWNHNITISCLKANLPALLWKATNAKSLKCSAGFKGCVGRIYV